MKADNMTLRVEPGALDDIPVSELARFLAAHGKELVAKPDGLTIRDARKKGDDDDDER